MTEPNQIALEAAKLSPCPFCGHEAKVERRDVEPQGDPWYGAKIEIIVICDGCAATLFDGYFHEGFSSNETAIAAWNRRASPLPSDEKGVEPVAWRWRVSWDKETWNWSDTEPSFSPRDLENGMVFDVQPLYAHPSASQASVDEMRRERDEAQSACTAWQQVFGSIEAHLMDRVNMRDEANPQVYLDIIRYDVAHINESSKAIVASRWHDYARDRKIAEDALTRVDEMRKALGAAEGYLLNAKVDLETGAPKRTAIATIEGGLKVVRAAKERA